MPDFSETVANAEAKDVIFQRSKLLNKYYEKVAKTAAGQGSCPRFSTFRAGYGLVDNSNPLHPRLLNIPADLQEIPNEFYRGVLTAEYSEGVTMCACEIPVGAISEPALFSLIGIFDQDDDLVAVCTTFPDWVTPVKAERIFPALTYPLDNSDTEADE